MEFCKITHNNLFSGKVGGLVICVGVKSSFIVLIYLVNVVNFDLRDKGAYLFLFLVITKLWHCVVPRIESSELSYDLDQILMGFSFTMYKVITLDYF